MEFDAVLIEPRRERYCQTKRLKHQKHGERGFCEAMTSANR